MKHRITHLSVAQMAKMLTALYACMGVIFVPFFLLASAFDPESRSFGVAFALFMPVLYALMGALSGAIGAALYNWIAGWLGGIEMEIDGSSSALGASRQVPS